MSSDSDSSGPTDRTKKPPAKKSKLEEDESDEDVPEAKAEKKKSKKASGGAKKKTEDDKFDLGKKRFVGVSEFKGRTMIDIREWYGDDDELKPGRKGISLSADQWEKLKNLIPEIDAKIEDL